MACSSGFIKFVLAGVNFTICLAGLALIISGLLYTFQLNQYTQAIPDEYSSLQLAPVLSIVIGSIIFIIAFLGCCGAVKESTCLLKTYAIILLVIFLAQIAIGIYILLEIKDENVLHEKVELTMEKLFSNYNKTESKELVDLIQTKFKCCGVNGSDYWGSQIEIPKSCYIDTKLNQDPCLTAFLDFLESSIQVIGITVLALSAIEIVGASFSFCLSNSIVNRVRRFRY